MEAVGALSGFLSRKGTRIYEQTAAKPALTPPGILFPIVWTILYGLMGISAAKVSASPGSMERSRALNTFIVQLVFNFFWSLLFFNVQAYGFALGWVLVLWVLIIVMIRLFWTVDRQAALLQLPYLVWVTFAAYLNFGVWRLNR